MIFSNLEKAIHFNVIINILQRQEKSIVFKAIEIVLIEFS